MVVDTPLAQLVEQLPVESASRKQAHEAAPGASSQEQADSQAPEIILGPAPGEERTHTSDNKLWEQLSTKKFTVKRDSGASVHTREEWGEGTVTGLKNSDATLTNTNAI